MRDRASLLLLIAALLGVAVSCGSDLLVVNGVELHHGVKGQGDLIVLFDAGALSGLEGWDSVWDLLPPDITAVRFSRRGEGGSGACEGQLTAEDYAKDVDGLLQEMGVGSSPVVYVSHSLGGIVARTFAAKYPDRVSALLFVDPANPRDVDIVRQVDPINGPPELQSARRQDYAAGEGSWCFLDLIWNKAPALGFAEIGDVPVTLIAGVEKVKNPRRVFDQDRARELWGEVQAEWVNQFPRGRAVVTEESGHFVQDEQPELVLEELALLLSVVRSE